MNSFLKNLTTHFLSAEFNCECEKLVRFIFVGTENTLNHSVDVLTCRLF